jgi:hypothetical protein
MLCAVDVIATRHIVESNTTLFIYFNVFITTLIPQLSIDSHELSFAAIVQMPKIPLSPFLFQL